MVLIIPTVHYTFGSPHSPNAPFGPRRVSTTLEHDDVSISVSQPSGSRRGSRKSTSGDTSKLANIINTLTRRSNDDMDAMLSTKLMNATHPMLLEWIRSERMSKLPPEGSGYDRVLVWASLFVERLHSFELAVEEFAGDSPMAAQLAYGHCAALLELGEENASALMLLFGFFCSCSIELVNLLDRAELFSVSQDIKDQLVLALADLVTLVVSVATHFHRSLRGLTSESVSIDIYSTFPGPIESFCNRCEHVSELMWRHQLLREGFDGDKVSDIKAIKRWLEPEDPVLENVAEPMAHLARERETLTCLWLTPYLMRFMKGGQSTLAISGNPGSGKTILSSVIADQLQYTIGGVKYASIYVPISNVRLYQILADAYDCCQKATDEEAYDNILWTALGHALKSGAKGARELVLIVDGMDEASCGEAVLFKRLQEATADNVKLITLGSQHHATTSTQVSLRITPDLVFDDIAAVVRSILRHRQFFVDMSEGKREVGVNRITQAAEGSFLWAKLAAERVVDNTHNTQASFKAVDHLIKARLTVTDLVHRSTQSKSLSEDGKKVLIWLATASRPLSERELSALLSIQVDKSVVGKLLAGIKDRNIDMVQRLLVYTKCHITNECEPSLSPLDPHFARDLMEKYPLLDFALRYWIDFTKRAFNCHTEGEITTAAKELRHAIPTSPIVPLLEMTVWETKTTPALMSLHEVETRLYQQILTANHPATLQTILYQALSYRRIYDALPSKAGWVFYYAAKISQDVLSVRHFVTMQMAKYFLEITGEHVTKSKTEIMMKRVEILQLLVECYKIHYGSASQITMTATSQLAEHYHFIGEESKAQELTHSLQTTSSESDVRRQSEDSLRVNLRSHHANDTVSGTTIDMDIQEEDQIIESSGYNLDDLITQAQKYIVEGKLQASERTYVRAWQRTSNEYRRHRSGEWEYMNVKAVLAYSRFLQSQKRNCEAASVLTGFWQEYDRLTSGSEAVVSQFLEVAKLMKSVGLTALALSVMKSCAQFYQNSGNRQSEIYKSIQQNIESTSKEVMQMANTSTTAVTESSLKEMVYNSAATLDQASMSATNSLVKMYISQHRWHDATKTLKKVLQSIWPALFAVSLQDVVLPASQADHCVALAEQLGDCYRSRRRAAKEEDIRQRVYRAVRRDRQTGDRLLERTTAGLLRLYERTSQFEKVIELHGEMLADYTKRYGAEHPTVIKNLWTLAELSPRHVSLDYYRRIIEALNKSSEGFHPDAFEPLVNVSTELWDQGRYSEAVEHYRVLFDTLRNPKISPKLQDPAFVQIMFARYLRCLRATHIDSSVLHDVAAEYRRKCQSLFGESASITMQATVTLANICQESKRYEGEAVNLYEELLLAKSDEVDKQDIRAMLDAIYEEQAAVATTKTDSITSSQLARVVSIRSRRLTSVRSSHGWAHEESLAQMEELISIYSKRGDSQAVVCLLREATVQVLSTETLSTRLTDAAKSIASCFIASDEIQQGRELAQELFRQIVAKDTTNARIVSFDLSSQPRHSLIFLAQMEYNLSEDNSLSVNEILSSLTTEYLFYEQLLEELSSSSSSVKEVITCAARLYGFLLARNRQWSAARLVDQCTSYLLSVEDQKHSNPAQVSEFVTTLLEYFATHSSQDFLRSVAIASHNQVRHLLSKQEYQAACDLALTSFAYIQSHNGYSSSATMMKLAFQLGLSISGGDLSPAPDPDSITGMLHVSSAILHETLSLFREKQIDVTQLNLTTLNKLIGLLDDQHDYHTLAWVLTSLWDNRETHRSSQPQYILALGRMLIITRYLVQDYTGAIRLAEDIVYNCARVYGPRHPATVEMTILLSQMYTSVAQGYQGQKEGRDMAFRYYRKAAALHENALRIFVDPTLSLEMEEEQFTSEFVSDERSRSPSPCSGGGDGGKYVRQHLHLLKLAVERLGEWPKEYTEYERLSSDVFRTYGEELAGMEGVEKWNLKNYGSGKAEATDDLIDVEGYQERHAITV
ncbi:hypothetical protein EYZ11_003870 [Aspergillus tanneri]|uniref:AAA+ ATPase domain-containing protein n=1 Tax=Aspergillus tanneri TaxID=1220188 RepID=A0A4S3JME9_9EURO|nr:hypothetical protein EYZ11_003870 [Aspergillus tanneri]